MRLGWAIAFGLLAGIALAWWLSRDPPEAARAKQARAEQAAAANAEDARPVLYRWRDDAGTLHITEQPPKAAATRRSTCSHAKASRSTAPVRSPSDCVLHGTMRLSASLPPSMRLSQFHLRTEKETLPTPK